MWGNYVAFSKICTHAGCPASLYEQQTNRLLCPCHQSQFLITDNARPVFGPASRRLPMLPIEVDEEGFFVAKSDFTGDRRARLLGAAMKRRKFDVAAVPGKAAGEGRRPAARRPPRCGRC